MRYALIIALNSSNSFKSTTSTHFVNSQIMKNNQPQASNMQSCEHHLPENKVTRKAWIKAVNQHGFTSLKRRNGNVEAQYHRIIEFVKKHHLKDGDIYFERDFKTDEEGYLAMHKFMTPHFYIYLECGLDLVYYVEYDFFNCTYEADIMNQLAFYPISERSIRKALQPDFPMYYQRTLRIQKCNHIHSFKG